MRLADAPESAEADGPTIALPAVLLRDDPRLVALFALFRECIVLHESVTHEGATARGTRLLMAEVQADCVDAVSAIVRGVCSKDLFEERATEIDDVAGGTDWRERAGSFSVSVYRLFGGSTSIHATSGKSEPAGAGHQALLASPLAGLAELVRATSYVEQVSCSRNAKDAPTWYLRAALRDLRRFEEIAPRLVALGFEHRRGQYRHGEILVRPLKQGRWMAALPGLALGP